jgi:putative NADPH-quinone reductase
MELTNKAFSIEENILFNFFNQVYPITEEELEPDLIDVIDIIKSWTYLWVFPMWWYGYPALMKGFIDRTFLPRITYQPIDGKPLPRNCKKENQLV